MTEFTFTGGGNWISIHPAPPKTEAPAQPKPPVVETQGDEKK